MESEVEALRDAIQDLLFCASHPPTNGDEQQDRDAALRLILAAEPGHLAEDFLRDLKAAAIRIGSPNGDELEECMRSLRRAQDILLASTTPSVPPGNSEKLAHLTQAIEKVSDTPESVDATALEGSANGDWQPATASPPPSFYEKYLDGSKVELAQWCSIGRDKRGFHKKFKAGTLWGRNEGGHSARVWFYRQEDYAAANKKRLESLEAAKAKPMKRSQTRTKRT